MTKLDVENLLEQTSDLNNFILDNVNDIIIITDLNGTIKYINEAFKQILGYEKSDYINESSYDFVHQDDVNVVKEANRSGMLGQDKEIKVRIKHENGQFRWFEIKGKPVVIADGRLFYISTCRDITEYIETEEVLVNTQKQINSIFSKLDKVYWAKNVKSSSMTMLSPSCERVFGVSYEEFLNKEVNYWKEFVHPEDLTHVENTQKKLKDGNIIDFEYRIINKKTNKLHWVHDRTIPEVDQSGNLESLSGILTDITEKKKVQEQLNLSGRVFESTTEGIMVTDLEGNITMINPAFTSITGYGEDIIGENPRVLQSGKHDKEFYKEVWDSIRSNGFWKGEIWNRRKSGESYVQWMTITEIKGDDGIPFSYASIFSDITARKELETKLHSDLNVARMIQKSVLSKPIQSNSFDINGVYVPSSELAGDMYAWYKIDESRYGVIVFDIMGHGVASSLVCMSIRSLLRGLITEIQDPVDVIKSLNKHMRGLCDSGDGSIPYYLTAVYMIIDVSKMELEYVSAGHPPALLMNEAGEITKLSSSGIPVGILPEIEIEKSIIKITRNSKVMIMTDGILDCLGSSLQESVSLLSNKLKEYNSHSNEEFLNKVYRSIREQQEGSFEDDVTMVSMTIK